MSKSPSIDPQEEARLIAMYRQTGELEHVGRLFNNYMHLVYGVCLKYLKNREESQDAVMQIFEKLTTTLKNHEVANFKSWLFVLSKNHCLMKLRSKQYQQEKTSKDISEVVMETDMVLHHNNEPVLEQDLNLLERCIDELQSEQKTCVRLFYLESKSYKEIEVLTTFELKKVKSYIQNGKRNLKNCMEKNRE
ncbi:RNA polymerase ECF-type sigma factor [Fulvivirga imtechensis AK7]|uniref:RNA polymerase ECF-type sigma factor n=1 Tax=Fulvivirga imtechensis AK7 TaxID=1237149 RepID=L8JZK6_9BACT|nr:RNA polymerase sigma factor [Fulvivirga imtechensis]ELR72627.1 RNA polymerase ECF-type sigma factor [Fulvivirga imtechensis AK7]